MLDIRADYGLGAVFTRACYSAIDAHVIVTRSGCWLAVVALDYDLAGRLFVVGDLVSILQCRGVRGCYLKMAS